MTVNTRRARVGVIIIHWNQPELVARAVMSVLNSQGVVARAVVVDNGSTAQTAARLDALLAEAGVSAARGSRQASASPASDRGPVGSGVVILNMAANLGFTGANNRGMSYAFDIECHDYAFFLNSDAILTPDCLHDLTTAWRPGIGLVGALVLDGEDASGSTISFGRGFVSWYGWPRSIDRGQRRERIPRQGIAPAEIVPGAAMLVPRAIWEALGGQDDRYFFDVDDTEYSLRAARAGYRNLMVWHAVCWHEMGSSVVGRTALSRYYNLRNLLLFNEAYNSQRRRVLFRGAFAMRLFRDMAACLRDGDVRRARAVYEAVRDYRRRQFGIGPPWIYERPAS